MPLSRQFLDQVFNASTMTTAINKIANVYGLMGEWDIAPVRGIPTTTVMLKYKDGLVSVLPSAPRGGPRTERLTGDEKAVYLEIPHFPSGGLMTPKDIQDKYAFRDDVLEPESLANAQAEHLEELRTDHDLNLEYMRCQMLFGQIRDGNGDLLVDLHAALGVPKTTIDFELSDPTTDVNAKCREVLRHFQKNNRGIATIGMPKVPCSSDFFDALKAHPNVEKFYLNYADAREMRGNNTSSPSYSDEFKFGKLHFFSYDAQVPLADKTSYNLIPSGKAAAIPQTVGGRLMRTYAAPPDRLSEVNKAPTAENLIYVSTDILPHDKGVDLDLESNPLPVNSRPDLIPELLAG